jgi:hypothetical protein
LIFVVEYLREYESIFEPALAHESVDPGVLFDEKTGGRKSRESVPLRKSCLFALFQLNLFTEKLNEILALLSMFVSKLYWYRHSILTDAGPPALTEKQVLPVFVEFKSHSSSRQCRIFLSEAKAALK